VKLTSSAAVLVIFAPTKAMCTAQDRPHPSKKDEVAENLISNHGFTGAALWQCPLPVAPRDLNAHLTVRNKLVPKERPSKHN